jgi:hypothetical protein
VIRDSGIKLTQIRAKKFGERKVIRDGGIGKQNAFKRFLRKFKR